MNALHAAFYFRNNIPNYFWTIKRHIIDNFFTGYKEYLFKRQQVKNAIN